jgi:pilus assembly protein Flp/PilA
MPTLKGSKMNQILNAVKNSAYDFAQEEDGAQVIEYALIVAVVSIALVIGLKDLNNNFSTFIGRVATCLTTANCI